MALSLKVQCSHSTETAHDSVERGAGGGGCGGSSLLGPCEEFVG